MGKVVWLGGEFALLMVRSLCIPSLPSYARYACMEYAIYPALARSEQCGVSHPLCILCVRPSRISAENGVVENVWTEIPCGGGSLVPGGGGYQHSPTQLLTRFLYQDG